jgi:hypothetical protein
VLQIFIALKNSLSWAGFEHSNLGSNGKLDNDYPLRTKAQRINIDDMKWDKASVACFKTLSRHFREVSSETHISPFKIPHSIGYVSRESMPPVSRVLIWV